MSEADGWEPRSSYRARELAQWGSLKDRISPLLSNPDTWSVTRAQRVASEASRVNRGKRYEPPAEEQSDESPLRVLGRMLEVGADTFRDIVPQEVRDVGGAVLNNLFSGERALNTWDRATRAPGEAVGGAIARGLGLDTSKAEETRAQQRPLGTMLGETVEQVPGVGGLLRTGLDVAAAPATILTAGAGGAVGGALRGGGRGGRILANLIEPVAPRGVGFGGRLAAETAAGVGATEGAQYAADQVENPYAKVGLGLLGGVAGGMAGAGLAAQGRAIARGGVNAARPSLSAETGSFRIPSDEPPAQRAVTYKAPPEFDEALRNTPDAYATERGIEINLFRFQKPEQAGEYSGRGGVFYLADEKSPGIRYYKQGPRSNRQVDYGGSQRVDERVVLERPLIVKAATGGRGPEMAYDQLKGKGAYEAMRSRVLDTVHVWGKPLKEWEVEQRVSQVLEEFGADTDLAYTIATTAKSGNQLPYAVQEAIVGAALREAGFDSMIAYNGSKAKGWKISEVFDAEMPTFPDPEEIAQRPTYAERQQGRAEEIARSAPEASWDQPWPLSQPHLTTGYAEPQSRVKLPNGRAIELSSFGDAVPGGYNGGWTAIDPATGERIGTIQYQYSPEVDDVTISWIEVPKGNPGVSDALVQRLQAEVPDKRLNPGYMTEDGARWWARVAPKIEEYRARYQQRPISGGAGQGGVAPPPALAQVFDFGPRASSGTREAVIGDTTITYGVNERTGIAEVTLVETPPNARRHGSARRAMEQMIREADEQGITLALTADPVGRGGASKTALEKFYQSLGFRKNTGRNADYRVWSQYVRKPKTISGGAGQGGVKERLLSAGWRQVDPGKSNWIAPDGTGLAKQGNPHMFALVDAGIITRGELGEMVLEPEDDARVVGALIEKGWIRRSGPGQYDVPKIVPDTIKRVESALLQDTLSTDYGVRVLDRSTGKSYAFTPRDFEDAGFDLRKAMRSAYVTEEEIVDPAVLPRPISGGAGQGGVAPPPALAQVFGIEEPAQGLTRAQEFRNTIKEALGQPFGLVLDDPIATPATQARARWADLIESAATIEKGEARKIIEAAGFQFDDKWGIPALNGKGSIPGNPTLQDVAARLPEYAPYLDPTQFQAIERIAKLMDPYGEVIRQTVGDLSPRGDVQPGGYYLHRGFEPEPEVRISIGGKIGGKAGFEKEAAYDSMAEAVAAGKTPLAPWDSIREYVADVGTRASDRYYSDYLKSTTDALGNKLGMTSADRVPVGLRKRMEDLRSKISARTQLLRGQEARGRAAEAELGRAERGAQEAGARVVGAYGKRAALPDVTAEDISAARQSVTDAISEARSLAAEIADHAAKLKGTQNGLNAREREIVAEAGRLEQTLAEADQLGLAADRLLSETRVTDLIRTPDTTVARYLEAGFPQEEQIRGRIDELSKLVTRGADGSPSEGASNVARLQEIGELQALDDIRYALGETGQWDDAALTKLEAVLEDVSRSLEVRDDAAMRARNRNAGGQYGGSEGMSGDLDSLRARAALLFRVWDSGSLEVPVPQLSGEAVDNATRTAVARAEANLKKAGGRALEREQRLLLRQADKIESSLRNLTDGAERMAERVDLATERGAILGDMDQAARQQLVESRRHERAILAGDRRIGAMDREIRILEQAERRAQRNVSAADVRAQRASARAGQTGADLAQLKAERDALAGDWEHAKALARQTPQGRAAIGLAELQGTDFPTQMANAANRILQSEMSTSGRLSQTIRSMAALNNLLRGMRATADWSFAGIQGAIGLANDPRAYWQAMKTAYQVLGDPNMRAAALGQWDEQNLAQGFLGMRGWTAAGIHQGASQTEYTLRGGPLKALTQMPGIGAPARGVKAVVEGANEAFGTFGDLLRMYHADMLLKRALAKGQIDQAAVLRAQQGMIDPRIRAIANHANLVTGWSPNKFGGEMGDVIQFAPRFFQSQLELSANALMKGGIEGKLARREMLQYLGLAAGTTVLANLALGNGFGDWAKPFKDDSFEKNPNFMRIRAGGRDYSLFGPWDSLLTAMMSAGKGDLGYLARTKASPMVQMTWDLLTGEDFMGNRVEPGANWDFAEWMAKQVTPFSLQDIPATAQQALEGDVFGAGLGLLTETAGVKSSPMTPNEELDAIAQRTAGKPYWNLEPYQREAIKAANPDVWQRSVARGSDARQRAEVVRSEYHAKQLKSDNDLLSGAVTRQQWRDQRSTRRVEQRARLEEIYGDATKRSAEPRNVYERYLALIDASVNPDTGQPDWEAVDAGLARMPAADQAEIEKSVGVGQTPLSREYAKLSKAYYALPRYKGFTADQAREIDAAWTEVKNASETQLGRLRKVRELQEAGVEEAVLKGVRARAMGKSLEEAPDRERFKKENPRYKVLSGSGKLTEADRAILDEVLRAAA